MTRARDIANLGDNTSKLEQQGMILIIPTSSTNGTIGTNGSVTFTSQSSVSLDGVFTSNYNNYKVLINATSLTGTLTFRFRSGSPVADNSTSNYKMDLYGTSLWTSSTYSGYQESGSTNFNALAEASPASISLDVLNPFETQKTFLHGQTSQNDRGRAYQGLFDATTSLTGFTILATSVTGNIRVYGYNQ